MASIAASLPRARTREIWPWVVAALLCAGAAALYGWMRVPLGIAEASGLHRMCARVAMRPGDWPCAITETRTVVSQVGSSLFTWLALAFPGAVLAASGRRYTWAIPVAVAAAATLLSQAFGNGGAAEGLFGVTMVPFGGGREPTGFWYTHPVAAAVVDLALVSIPALVIAFVVKPPRRARAVTPRRHASWVATFAVAGGIWGMQMLWPRLPIGQYVQVSFEHSLVAIAFIALAAAMVGTDRRFWPWWLAPAAVLLSLGPTFAIAGIPSRLVTLTWFAAVAPIGLAGLIGSLWRPIAMRLSGQRRSDPSDETPTSAPRRLRPIVVVHTLAVGLLALSAVAVRTDPLPVQISTSLPTFLGVRVAAEDARTQMNLLRGVEALDAYAAEHGSFAGFDATAGERLAPELRWSPRVRSWPLDVSVARLTEDEATLVVRSESGSAFCARTDGVAATFGSAVLEVGVGPRDPATVERAISACGDRPLTPEAVRTLDVTSMCVGIDDGALPLCRAVQRLVRETLASPTTG